MGQRPDGPPAAPAAPIHPWWPCKADGGWTAPGRPASGSPCGSRLCVAGHGRVSSPPPGPSPHRSCTDSRPLGPAANLSAGVAPVRSGRCDGPARPHAASYGLACPRCRRRRWRSGSTGTLSSAWQPAGGLPHTAPSATHASPAWSEHRPRASGPRDQHRRAAGSEAGRVCTRARAPSRAVCRRSRPAGLRPASGRIASAYRVGCASAVRPPPTHPIHPVLGRPSGTLPPSPRSCAPSP